MVTKTFGDKKISIEPFSAKDFKCAREYKDFINSLILEGAKILMNKPQTLKDEQDWVKKVAKAVKNKKRVTLIARDGNKIVANTEIEMRAFRQSHIGKFGIAIRQGYRGIGLGSYIMAEVLKLARKQLPGLKVFWLDVYENNKPAIALYKKMGFKIVGKIPKQIQHKGKLIGEYIMIRPA
jgi:ribosomal protein S18 acetylase RimI-like enzyme